MNPGLASTLPPVVDHVLRGAGVDVATAIRSDGRLSLRALGVRVDLQQVGANAIALSSPIVRLPGSKNARDDLVTSALRQAAATLDAPVQTLAIADGVLWLQQRPCIESPTEFAQQLAAFIEWAALWRGRLGPEPQATRRPSTPRRLTSQRGTMNGSTHR